MGSLLSMCCCCCPWCQDEEEEQQSNKNRRKTSGKSVKLRFKATDDEIDTEDVGDTVDPRQMATFKAGESSYSVQRRKFVRARKTGADKIVDKEINDFLRKNNYELHNLLGSGSYSHVYRVSRRNKNFAFKVIDLNKVEDHYKKNFLESEIGILKKIQSKKTKYIIKIIEMASTKNKVMIAMEFASNGTLTDFLKQNGALSEMAAQNWFPKILDAIVYLHGIRVAHRDIKLENILLTKKYKPKVSDFSYAIEVKADSPLSTQFCGTVPYFPPEILQRKPHNPLMADIWSLGICFYIMLNDKLPFVLDNDSLMLKQQLNKQWKHRPNVGKKLSPQLKNLIASMLEPNLSRRATAEKLATNPWITAAKELKKHRK